MRAEWAYERRRAFTVRRLLLLASVGVLSTAAACAAMAGVVGAMSVGQLVDPVEALVFVLSRGSLMPQITGIAAAVMVGAEYRYRTVELTVSLSPRRGRVVLAYFAGQTLCAAMLGLLGAIIAVVASIASIGQLPGWGTVAAASAIHVLTCVVWSLWSVALVLLTRSRGVAVLMLVLVAVVIEPAVNGAAGIIGGPFAHFAQFLPFTLLGSLMTGIAPSEGVLLATDARSALGASLGGVLAVTGLLITGSSLRFIRARSV